MLKIKELTKRFGDHEVLKGISLDIEQGEVVVVIGPSGGGKSTFLRCINYLEVPTSGEIWIDNVLLDRRSLLKLQTRVGMLFQHFNLFNNMRVIENILYAPRKVLGRGEEELMAKAEGLLMQIGLSDKRDAMPSSLSGGQKQRVAIVRALMMDPEILLLDEPTSALDPEMVKEVLNTIKSLAHTGMTLVMNTHEMRFAEEVADRVVFLDEGRIIEENKPREFFASPRTERVRSFLEKVL